MMGGSSSEQSFVEPAAREIVLATTGGRYLRRRNRRLDQQRGLHRYQFRPSLYPLYIAVGTLYSKLSVTL